MSNATFEAGGMRIEFLIEGDQTDDAIAVFRWRLRGRCPHPARS